jgi:hypothetical protein
MYEHNQQNRSVIFFWFSASKVPKPATVMQSLKSKILKQALFSRSMKADIRWIQAAFLFCSSASVDRAVFGDVGSEELVVPRLLGKDSDCCKSIRGGLEK